MSEAPAIATERLAVALVRGVHGLHGAVRVEVLTDRPEARFVPGAILYREGSDEPLTIASAEAVADGPGWRVRFREITSREGADTLRQAYLETAIRPEADLARGQVYWHEVIGVPVRGIDGLELGVVQDIYRVAENEVYVVGGGSFGTFDLPAVRAFIRIFAPRRGEIVVDAESLDLRPVKERRTDAGRPRAPRRTSRKRKAAPVDGEAGRGEAAAAVHGEAGRAEDAGPVDGQLDGEARFGEATAPVEPDPATVAPDAAAPSDTTS